MKQAFNYMFKDNCFYKKASVIYIISIVSNILLGFTEILKQGGGCTFGQTPMISPCNLVPVLLCSLLGLLVGLLEIGYTYSCVQGITNQNNNIILPFFNFKNNFIKGFKFSLGFSLILLLFTTITVIFTIISYMTTFLTFLPQVLFILFIIYFVVFGLAFVWMFANKGNRILTFFNIKEALSLINLNSKKYFSYVLLLFILILVSSALSFVIELIISSIVNNNILSLITYCLISSTFAVYFLYVHAYLASRAIEVKLD